MKTHWLPARLAAWSTPWRKAQATDCSLNWPVQAESPVTCPHLGKSQQTLSMCQELAKCFHWVMHVRTAVPPFYHLTDENWG